MQKIIKKNSTTKINNSMNNNNTNKSSINNNNSSNNDNINSRKKNSSIYNRISKNIVTKYSDSISKQQLQEEPKWYIIKINHSKDRYIFKELEILKQKKIILDYKKFTEICSIIKKYKLLFIFLILNNQNMYTVRNISYTYGFYPSNEQYITIDCLEKYKQSNIANTNTYNFISDKQEANNKLLNGQYVIINDGFFIGNKGRIISINGDTVQLEIDLFDHQIVTEIDIKHIEIN